eukprot:TRINITY_DN6651_c0_g1_i2.p2 TRINITY_DN6651_c0_g1~~TRINITY_DN6651_c0_g1_i2.p2  ORF type:complete len:158 (+),score=17.39 TRINITY_DN6651_c0_g1_i2:766-1239(+)
MDVHVGSLFLFGPSTSIKIACLCRYRRYSDTLVQLQEECEPLSLEEFCLDYKEKCHSILSGPGNPLGDYKTALPEKQLEVQELQRKHNLQRSKRFIYESLKQGIFFLVPSYKRMSHTKWSWLDTTLEKLGHKRLFDTIADVEQLKAMYSLKELRQMY